MAPLFLFAFFTVSGETYYLSPGGLDTNTGTSEGDAWRTIAHLNTIVLNPGDSVLFQAGYTWREELDLRYSGTEGNLIYYGRYGDGLNPKILGSTQAQDWTETGTANVWIAATPIEDPRGRNGAEGAMLILMNNSIYHADERQSSLNNLSSEFDWYYSSGSVYLYAPSDPDTRYESVEVQQRETCMTMFNNQEESWIEVNGIDLLFAINAGFSSGYPGIGGKEGLVFRNCNIGYIGVKGSPYAYGVEGYHANSLFENCTFSDNGRRSISWNLYVDQVAGEEVHISDLIIRNNVFKNGYHTTSLDCSSQLSSTDTIENVYFYNNIVDDSEIEAVGSWSGSNQIFFQNGDGAAYLNNIYVFSNVFIHASARNILYEGTDTTYTWNNTIVGHNQNITANPYANVAYNGDGASAFYKNNILYDNLGQVSLQNHGIMIYDGDGNGVFKEKDFNLYYSENPGYGGNRNFSAHKVNSTGGMGYWSTNDWLDYVSENTLFEQNSPEPQNPQFINYNSRNYRLTGTSAAIGAGDPLPYIIVTDPFGKVDTITKYDCDGNLYNRTNPTLGAYEYTQPDLTKADIEGFSFDEQSQPASINSSNHTVSTEVVYGTDVTNLSPTISLSYGASIDPPPGQVRDFTNPQSYTVTSNDGSNVLVWTVTVTIGASQHDLTKADIEEFSFDEQSQPASINPSNHTVSIEVVYGTDVTNLSPTISLSYGAGIDPPSGQARNFTNPQSYTVTSNDGSNVLVWTVAVTVEAGTPQNNPPEIQLVNSNIAYKGFTSTIDAGGTSDADGDPLSFTWAFPAGFIYSGTTGSSVGFIPDEGYASQNYTIGLDVSDGTDNVHRDITINVQDYDNQANVLELNVQESSNFETGNPPENMLDDNMDTRWSAEGLSWVVFSLENTASISYIKLAYHLGTERISEFELEGSTDNSNWDPLIGNTESSGFTSGFESFVALESALANSYTYLRFTGNLNSVNDWNSVSELKVYGNEHVGNSTEMIGDSEIAVYPNPTTGIVHIELPEPSKIKIINISGAIVYENYYTDNNLTLYLQLPDGYYTLSFVGTHHAGTRKILIMN